MRSNNLKIDPKQLKRPPGVGLRLSSLTQKPQAPNLTAEAQIAAKVASTGNRFSVTNLSFPSSPKVQATQKRTPSFGSLSPAKLSSAEQKQQVEEFTESLGKLAKEIKYFGGANNIVPFAHKAGAQPPKETTQTTGVKPSSEQPSSSTRAAFQSLGVEEPKVIAHA